MAVTILNDNDVAIRLGNGDGTFTSRGPDVEVGKIKPVAIALGLFNADSNLDMAVVNPV